MVQIAVVTGGSRGLGRSDVLALAKRGIHSVFTYNSNEASAKKVVEEVKAAGADAATLPLDVSKPETLDAFVAKLKETLQAKWGIDKFDFLVNNAGVGSNATVESYTAEELDTLYTIHIKSVFLLTQKVLPLIKDGGRILNVSTGLTRFVIKGFIAYASIKAALEVYTKYLAVELGPRNIRVNVIAPGAINTDFGGGAVRDVPEINKYMADTTALGRPGEPDEIGDAVAVLLAPETRWISGARIEVSGGQQL